MKLRDRDGEIITDRFRTELSMGDIIVVADCACPFIVKIEYPSSGTSGNYIGWGVHNKHWKFILSPKRLRQRSFKLENYEVKQRDD